MPRAWGLLTGVAVAAPFVLGTFAAAADDPDVVFRFQDPQVVESSGLVVQDGLFVTTNDSGDTGRVFSVDPATGETVGVTTWADAPLDVEALAPGTNGRVWVADIGDNEAVRSSVEVARVAIGRGEREGAAATYELAYPKRPADAETLLAHPVTGRLYVATKGVFGGDLYAAPRELDPDGVNELKRLDRIIPIATDGAFFPDGRHLVLRDYGRAVIYTFPGLEVVADLDLPEQEQGEGIAVSPEGEVFVSSEGRQAPVLRVPLPPAVREQVEAPVATTPSPTVPGSREGRELPETTDTGRPRLPWFVGGWIGLGVIVAVMFALRRR